MSRGGQEDLLQHTPGWKPAFLQTCPADCSLHPSSGLGLNQGGGARGKTAHLLSEASDLATSPWIAASPSSDEVLVVC